MDPGHLSDTPKQIPYQAHMNKTTPETTQECTRCGDCCRNGGPSLHMEDLEAIRSGLGPGLENMVTIRTGEYAFDQLRNRFAPIDNEFVKLKGSGGSWTCIFFSEQAGHCTIYDHRPAECRALDCHDLSALEEIHTHEHITRRHLIPEGHPLLELIDEHDRHCPPVRLAELATPAATGDEQASAELETMIRYDDEMRKLIPERAGLDADAMDFLLGRPARALLRQFATAVTIEKNGRMAFRKIPKRG